MFHFKTKLYTLAALLLSFLILSCSDDNSTNNTDNCTKVTAKVTDSLTLDFAACTTIFTKVIVDASTTQRNLTATMKSGTKTYILILSIYDKGSGAGTYKLDTEGGQISLSDGTAENTFNYYPDGEITLTTVSDNSWVGSFHAEIKNGINSKVIKINNGKVNVK